MSSSSSSDTPDQETIDIMNEISSNYPVLHRELVEKLPIITSNIDKISNPKDKKEAKQLLFESISDRLYDTTREKFAKKFDIPYKPWDVDAERNIELSNKRLRKIIKHDRSADPSITVTNPHVRVVKDDGTVNYETVRFSSPLLGEKRHKPPVKVNKKRKGGRKTNNKKKISKQKRTLRKK